MTQIVTKTKKGRDFLCMKSPDWKLFVLSRYNKEWMDRWTDGLTEGQSDYYEAPA